MFSSWSQKSDCIPVIVLLFLLCELVMVIFCIISGIPTLVILDGEGTVITDNGRGKVSKDPEGKVSTQAMRNVGALIYLPTLRPAFKL